MPDDIRTSDPVDGKILAMWLDGDKRVVELVDTADGSRRELRRMTGWVSASLSPSGRHWCWVSFDGERWGGLWRQPISGGRAVRLVDPWRGGGGSMIWSTDGSRLAIAGRRDGFRNDYRIFEPESGRLHQILDAEYGEVVGFLGEELLVRAYTEGERQYPILAIDPADGSTRMVIGERDGIIAAVIPTRDGPRLVYNWPDDDMRLRFYAHGLRGEPPTLLYTGQAPWWDSRAGLVHGIELEDWIAIFPRGEVHANPERPDTYEGIARILINVTDGTVVEVPPLHSASVSQP